MADESSSIVSLSGKYALPTTDWLWYRLCLCLCTNWEPDRSLERQIRGRDEEERTRCCSVLVVVGYMSVFSLARRLSEEATEYPCLYGLHKFCRYHDMMIIIRDSRYQLSDLLRESHL